MVVTNKYNSNGNVPIYLSNTEYYCIRYDSITSPSVSLSNMKQFYKPFGNEDQSIVLKIECSSLRENSNLIDGDISWISEYKTEKEILKIKINIANKNDLSPKNVTVYSAALKSLNNISVYGQQFENHFRQIHYQD